MFELTDQMTAKVLERRREGYEYAAILREFESLGWSNPADPEPPYDAIIRLAKKHGLTKRGWRKFSGAPTLPDDIYQVVFAVDEGDTRIGLHLERERDQAIVKAKKASVLADGNGLPCEACGFDFSKAYGEHGLRFIECHHLVPLSSLTQVRTTSLQDLALVCANCHRMIHRRKPWLSLDELRAVIAANDD